MTEIIWKDYFRLKGANAEKLVHDIATKSFLVDWCFLNPKLPNGKELCDLLVVFDDIVIIWQIKDLKLGTDGKYKKAEVEKNLKQVSGARRQLFEIKTPIKLENNRRKIEIFDPTKINKIFLISVLFGEGEDFWSFHEEIKGNKAHIFTRNFTEIVLEELDTISDFVDYLESKELFIDEKKSLVIMWGEEEFLAYYLKNNRNLDELKKYDKLFIWDWSREDVQKRPEYKAKKKEDEFSYGRDDIINRAHEWEEMYELVARELARPNRFERRCLGKSFYEAHVIAHKEEKNNQFRRIMFSWDTTYCFLFQESNKNRKNRISMLAALCEIARWKYPQNHKVVWIATEMKIRPRCSYDFCFLNLPTRTEEDQRNMEKLQKETGILVDPIIKSIHEDEYPTTIK